MLKRLLLAAALAAGFASPALAQGVPQVIATCGVGVSLPLGPGGRLYQDQTGILCTTAGTGGGGGSGGSTGSVTAAGTSGSVAQAVQGITGGVPQNGFTGQYNSTLPTLASGASGYLAVDSNGRLIQSPGASVSVSNFPASQAVTNAGTFAVQNTTAMPAGTNNIGSLTNITGTVTLPTGAATAANQNSEISALGTTADTAYAGTGNASIIAGLKGVYTATLAPLAAGTNTIGSIANISGTVSLPTGASTAANQATEITALQAIQQRAAVFSEQTGASVAASGTLTGTSRDAGTAPLYTKFNAVVSSNQSGTLFLQGSNDNFTTLVGIASVATTANVPAYITAPVMFRYHRYVFANGTTAATASVNTSYTAN